MDIILTFLLYTGTASLSAIMFEKACNGRRKKIKKIWLILAIAIPSLIAGMRSGSVGSDTAMYIQEYYSPGSYIFGTGFTRTFEIGFRLLRDGLSAIHMPHQVYLFIIQAMTLSFLFAAAYEERKEASIKLIMFVYMFDSYFQSLNMMRQALAVAIVIYSYTQIVRDRYIRGVLLIVLASLFHQTAIVCLLVVGVKFALESKHAKIYIAIGITIIAVLLFNNSLLQRLAVLLLGNKAIWYTTRTDTGSRIWVYLLKVAPIVLIVVLCIKSYKNNKKVIIYSGLVLAGYVIAVYGNLVATDAQRIALYISRLDAIVLGYAASTSLTVYKKRKLRRKHISAIICAYYVIMFTYNYFILGVSNIVPYSIY